MKTDKNQDTKVMDMPLYPDEGMVRVGGISIIPSLLRKFECDPNEVVKSVDLTVKQVGNMDSTISFLAASRLLNRCIEVTGCPHFGLLLGQQISPSHLGLPGFTIITSPTVAAALESLAKYMDLHDRAGTPTIVSSEESILLGYAIYQPDVEAPDHIYDMTMAFACSMMRQLCGPNWAPTEVLLSREVPEDVSPYKRFFRAPIRFNSDESGIVFSTRWLSHKPPLSDHYLHDYLHSEARNQQHESQRSMVGQLHFVLKQSIALQDFTLATVAQQLGMHQRTLNRRLKSEGTTFRKELDNIRRGMSEQLLGVTSMEIWKIATVLGYSSTSAFNHAFRRWYSVGPVQWRLENKKDVTDDMEN